MSRYRSRATCGAFVRGAMLDEETGQPTVCVCTLPAEHRLDQHFDRRRNHWWPRVDAPTLPAPAGLDSPPVDDLLF